MNKNQRVLMALLLLAPLTSLPKRIANGFLNNPLSRITCLTRCIRPTASAMRREAKAFATPDNAIF